MLKYIALVSFCAGAAYAGDFITGQAARAVIGQPTFTAQATASVTTSASLSGTVNTSDTTVTLVSGASFPSSITGASININSVKYSVATWISASKITLSTTAGTQSAVAYSITLTSTAYGCTGIPVAGVCFTKSLFGAMGGLGYVNNTLFVTDSNHAGLQPSNNRVLIFNGIGQQLPASNVEIAAFQGRCPVCGGSASIELDDVDANNQPIQGTAAPTRTGVRQPTAVASDGRIFAVADTANNRVLIWNSIPSSDHQPADLVLGQPDFVTLTQPLVVTASAMRGPQGVWIQANRLFVADTQNNRVLIWNSIPTRNNQPADVVLGQPDFTTAPPINQLSLNVPATSNTMLSPVSVTSDGIKLYVADLGFNRVLIWNNIPSANQKPADVVIGQHDFLSSTANDATNLCDSTLNATVNVTTTTSTTNVNTILVNWVSGQTFPSSLAGTQVIIGGTTYTVVNWISSTQLNIAPTTTAVNLTNVAISGYPNQCGATLNFPRYAISDGQYLFVADGGNDRVLIFKSVPNPAPGFRIKADVILGQPDEFSNLYSSTSSLVTSATDTTPTPTSLAWDGLNLYVADPSNYRILVFSPQTRSIPQAGVVNAASRAVYATGSVAVGGTIRVQDTANITINSAAYTYTVKTGDTLDLVAKGLSTMINNASDKNVLAYEVTGTAVVNLIARQPGSAGNQVTLATSIGTNDKVTVTASSSSLSGGASAAEVGPGTLVLINGQNLTTGSSTGSAPLTAQLPFELAGAQVYIDGMRAPLFLASPTQLGVQIPWPIFGANSASLWVRTRQADGSFTVTNPIGIPILTQNPGIFACNPANPPQGFVTDPTAAGQCDPNGNEPRTALAFHTSDFATSIISVDGSIQAGDTAKILIGSTQIPFIYNIQEEDTLTSIRDGLIAVLNSDPNNPLIASATGEFNRILMSAKVPGAAGSGVAIATSVSSTILQGPQITLSTTKGTTCCFAINGSHKLVTPNNPAIPGEIIGFYAAGLGLVAPETARISLGDGTPYAGPANFPRTDVSALAGSGGGTIVSASLIPGYVGLYEVHLELATALNPNPLAQLTISQGASTSNVVTIPIATPAAAYLTVTTTATIVAGTAFNVNVSAFDLYNNPVANYSGTVVFSSSDSAATLPGPSTVSGGNSAFAVTFTTSGTKTITVVDTITGITGTGTIVVP